MRKGPGSTIVTPMPSGASSIARASDNPSTANFVELSIPHPRQADESTDGGKIDHVAAVLLAQMRKDCLRQADEPEDVRLVNAPDLRVARLLDRAEQAVPDVVDQHIDATESRDRGGDRPGNLGRIVQIESDSEEAI